MPGPVVLPAQPASRGRNRLRRWLPAVASTIVVTIAVAASIAGQSSMPRGDYRTIEGLTAALAARGLPCRSITYDPAPPAGVRAAAVCSIGSAPVWLVTFGAGAKRDRYLRASPPTLPVAIGRTWLAVTSDEALARTIASSLGARFRPVVGIPGRVPDPILP